jgi:hypothetical protein
MERNLKEFEIKNGLYIAEITKTELTEEHQPLIDFRPIEYKKFEYSDFYNIVSKDSEKMMVNQLKEWHCQKDSRGLNERNIVGLTGEYAVRLFLGLSMTETGYYKNSKEGHVPDLRSVGFEIGVKTRVYDYKFPYISKREEEWPEIMAWSYGANSMKVVILGYASMKVLNDKNNQDDSLVTPDSSDRKTCFTALHLLKPFSTLEELIAIDKECWANGENYITSKNK